MPSVDQVTKSDNDSNSLEVSKMSQEEEISSSHDHESLHNSNGKVVDAQNGHVAMETKPVKTVNAHLVKSGVICLDRSPVKPVVMGTNGSEEISGDKMTNKEINSGCHGNTTEDFNSKHTGTETKSEKNNEEIFTDCNGDFKFEKKPLSFDLLPCKILKKRTPSRHGKLARQRAVSETSYKKEHYRMVHAKSDPTGYDSDTVFEDDKSVKTEKEEDVKEKAGDKKLEDTGSHKRDKDVDTLAENLEASLKIASSSTKESEQVVTEDGDQQVSELADNLKSGLCVTNKEQTDLSESALIVIKKEAVSVSPSEEIIFEKDPEDTQNSSPKITVKKEPEDAGSSPTCKKEKGFSARISEDKTEHMLSRGPPDQQAQYRNQLPMTGYYTNQASSYASNQSGLKILGFQEAFISHQSSNQMSLQGRQFVQQQMQQHVQPPFYQGSNQQQQHIIVPPSTEQTIVLPTTNSGHQRAVNQIGHVSYPNQHVFPNFQQPQHHPMPLQQPQYEVVDFPIGNNRQPEENSWPCEPNEELSETTSISSPHGTEEIETISSPLSVSSDGSNAASIGLGPVSPQLGNQRSPAMTFPTSPNSTYHTVPSLSPEMPPVNSPQAASPGSPANTSQIILTGIQSFGSVTINDGGKPTSPKRQCMEDPAKHQQIENIVTYLKQNSPVSAHEQEQDCSTSPPRSTSYQPVSPAASYSSSCDTPPPPARGHQYQPEPQRSPPPGVSPVAVQPVYRPPYPQQHVISAESYQPQHTMMQPVRVSHTDQTHPPTDARMPTQMASQQTYELQDWRQKVASLSEAQLKEQDEDKDTILHLAVIHEQKSLMMALVERLKDTGAINMKNKQNQTPLFLAAAINQPEYVLYLICHGADPTIPAEVAGDTPLHFAAKQGFVGVIDVIFRGLGRSPDDFIDRKNFEGKSPLHCAVEVHGQVDTLGSMETIDSLQTIEMLMRYGASAMCQDGKSGKTPLHYSVEMHKHDVTQLLLDRCDNAGELVNSQTYNGNTALHLVVGRQQVPKEEILKVVALLMSRGANVSIENAEKDTAVKLVQPGHNAVKRHLSGQAHGSTAR